MALTGATLLTGLSSFINDDLSSTTTSAGNSGGTTLIDTVLTKFGDGQLTGQYIRITLAGGNAWQIRQISDNTQATGTVTVTTAFAGQVVNATTYELHRFAPVLKFRALDKARLTVVDTIYKLVYDDTVTSDGDNDTYPIPSSIDIGPILAIAENPVAFQPAWNFIASPMGNDTSVWTAVGVTAATLTRISGDLLVPRLDDTCTKFTLAASTAGTYTQVVASMINGATAALAADRPMTFAAWVFCTEASKIRLRILDDSGTVVTSSYHGGAGWELLSAEATAIAGNNATTLSARFVIESTANASTIYWNRAWFYFGEAGRVRDSAFAPEHSIDIRRDDTTARFTLATVPPRGYQIRLIGKAAITALGTTASTQVTNTMEVSEKTAEVLYAEAAELLLQWERFDTEDSQRTMDRIAGVRERRPKIVQAWAQETPRIRLTSPFGR